MSCFKPTIVQAQMAYDSRGPQPQMSSGGQKQAGCGGKRRGQKGKRYTKCTKTMDKRIYRNGEFMTLSYAGHIPGEMYIYGRTRPTSSTYCKRRLCQYTPYEYVDPDGKCSCCVFH